MQTIRTGFWVLLAVFFTLFTVINSEIVSVRLLPGNDGTVAEMPLALVIVTSFLLGLLPMFLMYRTARWTAERKIRQQDETIALLRPSATAAPAAHGHHHTHDAASITPAATPLSPDPLP